MHCLEVIVKRNNEAAGRELGHKVNDAKGTLEHDAAVIADFNAVCDDVNDLDTLRQFRDGYERGRSEG
jgi:hypothetical protein